MFEAWAVLRAMHSLRIRHPDLHGRTRETPSLSGRPWRSTMHHLDADCSGSILCYPGKQSFRLPGAAGGQKIAGGHPCQYGYCEDSKIKPCPRQMRFLHMQSEDATPSKITDQQVWSHSGGGLSASGRNKRTRTHQVAHPTCDSRTFCALGRL